MSDDSFSDDNSNNDPDWSGEERDDVVENTIDPLDRDYATGK